MHHISIQELLAIAFILSAFATFSSIDYEHEQRLEALRKNKQVAQIDWRSHP